MPNGGHERRQSLRTPLLCAVAVVIDDETTSARMVDLSLTGAFLEIAQPLPVGTELRLTFTLPRGLTIESECTVRYLEPGLGLGVEFNHLDDQSRQAIAECVAELKR